MGLIRGEDPRLREDDITNGEQIQKKILNQVQDDRDLWLALTMGTGLLQLATSVRMTK